MFKYLQGLCLCLAHLQELFCPANICGPWWLACSFFTYFHLAIPGFLLHMPDHLKRPCIRPTFPTKDRFCFISLISRERSFQLLLTQEHPWVGILKGCHIDGISINLLVYTWALLLVFVCRFTSLKQQISQQLFSNADSGMHCLTSAPSMLQWLLVLLVI